MKTKTKKQGGFSRELAELELFDKYVEGRCGYFSHDRTAKSDRAIENALREVGLKENGILDWLGCSDARRSFCEPFRGMSVEQLDDLMKDACEDAFVHITVVNHPDHRGTAKCTETLKKILHLCHPWKLR